MDSPSAPLPLPRQAFWSQQAPPPSKITTVLLVNGVRLTKKRYGVPLPQDAPLLAGSSTVSHLK